MTVPNFPAWVCDVCGRREYDKNTIHWLNMILSPNAGRPAKRPRPTRKRIRGKDLSSSPENGPINSK